MSVDMNVDTPDMTEEQQGSTLSANGTRSTNPTRDEVLGAIRHAHDKATVREARRLVRYWIDDHPDDTEIPLAAEALNEVSAALVAGEAEPEEPVQTHLTSNQITAERWLTVSEAAALLKVSERTIRRRCEAGKLQARRESNENGVVWLVEAAAITADTKENPADAAVMNNSAAANLRPHNSSSAAIAADSEYTADKGAAIAADTQNGQIQVMAGEVHLLRGEVEQLKAFIAGGAMQALNERLATLPDADTLRALLVENQAQIVSVAVAQAVSATQQSADDRRAEMTQAVQEGITAALQIDVEREAEQQAQTASKDDVKGIVDRLEKVLERQQWLEEDNANLRRELEAQRGQGFLSRLFKKKGVENS